MADKGDFQPFDKIWSPDKCYYMLVLKQHKKEERFPPSGNDLKKTYLEILTGLSVQNVEK